MVTTDQVDALLTGLIDIGFVRPPLDRHEFDTVCVQVEPLVVALPAGDPRQAKAVLELGDFDGLPLIMRARQGAGISTRCLSGCSTRPACRRTMSST
ncbi:LysR substrate-binding domain-containing protein [Sphingomonas aerolata]|uniref:LysR substrate-binding domain-containing protein n=1 Tax=Sphingomonas aerolata TaxID=185951 RepID=UPI003A5BB364